MIPVAEASGLVLALLPVAKEAECSFSAIARKGFPVSTLRRGESFPETQFTTFFKYGAKEAADIVSKVLAE